jgi:predicted O-methyltransferase YrrM
MVEDKKPLYNFKNNSGTDIAPLIQAINVIGQDLVGCELGAHRGYSTMTMLHNCSLKKLFVIDNWKPYVDYLKQEPDGQPAYIINEIDSEINEFLFNNHLKYSGSQDKVSIIKKDSLDAVKTLQDNSLDFLFFDAMLDKNQTYEEAHAFYPKLKQSGYFMGHDANCFQQVIEPINKFKSEVGNTNKLMIYNNTFLFKK